MNQIPKIVIPTSVELPRVEVVTLPNGLDVHLICTPAQEVARVSFVFEAGSARQAKPFVASSTLNLLSEGSTRLSAHQIAEQLDFHGSYFDVNIDRDYAVATFACLDKFFAPTLGLVSEIMFRPAFPAEEVAIYATKRKERLAVERSKPATKSREQFAEALFGDEHPYGISSPEADYDNLTRADIEEFYRRFYVADNCFVVCSLSDDPAQKEALLALLRQMRTDEKPLNEAFPAPHTDHYRYLPIKGAVQSAIRIGRVLFARSHPDFVGMQVLSTLLGGYFGSRLIQNLRQQRGYTYGVFAAMVNMCHTGYIAIATEVGADVTTDAVEQIFAEMERLKTEPVSEDELENVKRNMLGEVMRILDGPFGIVDVVIENIQTAASATSQSPSGVEIDSYINGFIREIEATTPARIMDLARRYLTRPDFTTVIVGQE
jgi:predicted Zn-dependent peptidase